MWTNGWIAKEYTKVIVITIHLYKVTREGGRSINKSYKHKTGTAVPVQGESPAAIIADLHNAVRLRGSPQSYVICERRRVL